MKRARKRRRPKLVLTERAHAPKLGTAPILGAILLLGGATTLAILGDAKGQDPHLVRAREILAQHERTSPAETRDYEQPAYREAAEELRRVPPDSPSAPVASALASDLERRLEAQRALVRARTQETAARQEAEQTRDARFFEAQARNQRLPETQDACEEPPEPAHPE